MDEFENAVQFVSEGDNGFCCEIEVSLLLQGG